MWVQKLYQLVYKYIHIIFYYIKLGFNHWWRDYPGGKVVKQAANSEAWENDGEVAFTYMSKNENVCRSAGDSMRGPVPWESMTEEFQQEEWMGSSVHRGKN